MCIGLRRYWKRRLLRILPAYYSAVVLVYILAVPLQRQPWVSLEAKCASSC